MVRLWKVKMTQDELLEMLDEYETHILDFEGNCHGCGKELVVSAGVDKDKEMLFIQGGGVAKAKIYNSEEKYDKIMIICPDCYEIDKTLYNWNTCEVFARSVGYMRPLSSWHKAKRDEFKERKMFDIKSID